MKVERKNYAQLGDPVGPYVHATTYNGVLYTSGMTAFGSEVADGDINAQAIEVYRQLSELLSEEGSGLDKLLKVTLYVTDIASIASLRDTLFSVYGNHIPASSVVEVSRLFAPNVKIEIEAIAALS